MPLWRLRSHALCAHHHPSPIGAVMSPLQGSSDAVKTDWLSCASHCDGDLDECRRRRRRRLEASADYCALNSNDDDDCGEFMTRGSARPV